MKEKRCLKKENLQAITDFFCRALKTKHRREISAVNSGDEAMVNKNILKNFNEAFYLFYVT